MFNPTECCGGSWFASVLHMEVLRLYSAAPACRSSVLCCPSLSFVCLVLPQPVLRLFSASALHGFGVLEKRSKKRILQGALISKVDNRRGGRREGRCIFAYGRGQQSGRYRRGKAASIGISACARACVLCGCACACACVCAHVNGKQSSSPCASHQSTLY